MKKSKIVKKHIFITLMLFIASVIVGCYASELTYLPALSIAEGKIQIGANITKHNNSANPLPTIINLTGDFILPDGRKASAKGIKFLAEAFYDETTNRIHMRLHTMTDKHNNEYRVKGFVSDISDKKIGVALSSNPIAYNIKILVILSEGVKLNTQQKR